ncbi:vacuolar sorting protein 39 domain 2-domain-containing protein [Lobosporangium transversale]|uniref:Vacuolar sorting protein 39 domain 2-domain-containing protein n=1 Tax=Lobosporangium transversale TaxID=64571 RepID=A0A1Y2GPQ4_9FUNG|nr:vacuolar sorting protein 39 domain 2-domain-containing protein [Lobosporangium transversale]ORZ13809.1 vacuolar sorting protein 39 domain 2-domain-containing protein [Lobosporangium transversale]|eukprot:XP_021880593.1 vacuolar sorting protein 39 domain 2-domain-containing protein [Lobosporangium transversale]
MHDAFKVYTVIEKLPHKIESIFAQGDKLYVGTFYGALLVYSVREPLGKDEAISVTLMETLKTFSKKAIEQIDIIKAVGVLVTLSDNYVNLHDLESFALRTQLGKTKGANLFSVFSKIEFQDGSVPQVITRLAVAVRKKIIVFSWQDSEFMDTKEYSIPDRVRTMEWVGTQNLCMGFDNEYALMDCKTSALTTLFSPSSASNQGAIGSTLESTLNTLNSFSSIATGGLMGFGSKPGKPLITRLPNDEILLGKEHSSISVGIDGTPKRKNGIEWSGTPEELGYSYPYAVAILARHIEIRNIETRALVQSADLPHARLLTQGKLLYIASHSEVWRLIPYSFPQQIDELVQKEEYQEAISLINQIDPVLLDENVDTLGRIKKLYAHHLFRTHQYEEALGLFLELDVPAVDVIALYPAVISGHLPPKDKESGAITSATLTETDSNSLNAKNTPPIIMSTKELEEAVGCLIRFLADKRQKIQKSIQKLQQNNDSFSYNHQDQEKEIEAKLHVLEIVDTALLKSYMMTNERLVGSLLRVTNHCNLEETESLLLKHKKYKELVDFYRGKGQHRKALELLKSIHTTTGEMQGVLPTVHYLQRLGADHFNLILEFGTWILESDPVVAMKIFIDDEPEIDTLPRYKVISYLERLSLDLCAMYLEHVIHELADQTSEFHNTLVVSYLSQVQRDSASGNEEAVKNTRVKLLQFLDKSKFYKAERILSRLPLDGCFEERAILLSRIGQHDQALNIYVRKLHNFQAAEEYCIKNFDSNNPTKNVYFMLLEVYLIPPKGEKPMLEPALDILTRHGNHIDPAAVLRLLPAGTRVDQLYKFFEKSIRESNKTKHMNMIVKNLLKAERLQTQEQLTFYRSRRVKITEDRMCPKCNKRIGNSVFAVFPDGVVVHYSCKETMAAIGHWRTG